MPVLLKDYRVNDFSGRRTVYSKLKSVTDSGFVTSNDYFAENFTRILGINNESLTKDFLSSKCNDIIYVSSLNKHIACGTNWTGTTLSRASPILYSEDNGVSWTFANDTFDPIDNGFLGSGSVLIFSGGFIFCGGGTTGNKNCLMKSSDGINWQEVPCPLININKMVTDGSQNILVAGRDEFEEWMVLSSVDNGSSWQQIPLFTSTASTGNVMDVTLIFVNNTYYIGSYFLSRVCLLFTSSDLNTWTDISNKFTFNLAAMTLLGVLNSISYSNDTGIYMICMGYNWDKKTSPVFYSSDGINFIGSPGLPNTIRQANDSLYSTADSRFYLSVQYEYGLVNTTGLSVMYTSPDGSTWTSFLNNTDIKTSLPTSIEIEDRNVLGISHFYIDNFHTAIYAIGFYSKDFSVRGNINYSFGLINIDLTGSLYETSTIAINGQTCTKLLYDNSTFIVGMANGSSREVLDNTIYYQRPSDSTLQPTEHADDV